MKKLEIASRNLQLYAGQEKELAHHPLLTNVSHFVEELRRLSLKVKIKSTLVHKYCFKCGEVEVQKTVEFPLSCGHYICSAQCLKAVANEDTQMSLNNLREVVCRNCGRPVDEAQIYKAFGGKVNVDIIISRAAERMIEELTGKQDVVAKECQLCYGTKPVDEFLSMTLHCDHSLCKDCFVEHLEYLITYNLVKPDKFVCAEVGCGQEIDPYIALEHLKHRPELIEKFYAFRLREIQSKEKTTNCPGADCPGIIFFTENTVGVLCELCMLFFCPLCKDTPHSGRTCDEYREFKIQNDRNEAEFQKMMIEQGCKQCPSCLKYAFKYDGCNFMTCVCGIHYCYLCARVLTQKEHYSHFRNKPFGPDCLGKGA